LSECQRRVVVDRRHRVRSNVAPRVEHGASVAPQNGRIISPRVDLLVGRRSVRVFVPRHLLRGVQREATCSVRGLSTRTRAVTAICAVR
jgi:hypothetical protein